MDINLISQFIVEAAQNTWAALSMFGEWFATQAWPHIWDLFIIGVIYKVIVAHWIADKILSWLKGTLIQTHSQWALWIHYRDRAMRHGHNGDPNKCLDGLCAEINASKQ